MIPVESKALSGFAEDITGRGPPGGLPPMIRVTRLNGEEFIVNAELIRFIESRPDTFITLTTEDRFVVRESADEVVRRTVEYARAIRLIPGT